LEVDPLIFYLIGLEKHARISSYVGGNVKKQDEKIAHLLFYKYSFVVDKYNIYAIIFAIVA